MLRQRAQSEPWKSMKEDALSRSATISSTKPYDLQYYIGAAALAYILDEENAQIHAIRVKDAIINQYSKLELQDGDGWSGVVPPMGSFFVAILALDIVYDALSEEDIKKCEDVISSQIFKIDRTGPWVDVRYGTHGTWDIYKGDRTTPDDDYYEGIMHQVTEDGVSPVTNHYAWERIGGGDSRLSKSGYMDVLEFTGIDQRYYNNPRMQLFYRWLFGSSINCAKEMAIFGDMLPTQNIHNDMLHRRVGNFDSEAAGYASWFHQGTPAIGNILTYILPKQALPEAVVPSSKLYTNGGAFFRDPPDNADGLHGVLYNIKSQDEWHTHNEVNGLALSGYGNRLLVNGGRLGEPTRAANLNNTLTINGVNHNSRVGGGIIDGFTTPIIDYSSGDSGPALTNATHIRNMILMHRTSSALPYFVLFDDIEASSGDQVNTYLHPANESNVATILDKTAYEAVIDHYPTVGNTSLNVFYGTPPTTVSIEKVESAVQDRYPGYPKHNRLDAAYQIPANGKLNLLTALFPHNSQNPKPAMDRIAGQDYTGIKIDHTVAIKDILLESSGEQAITHHQTVFNGKSLIYRTDENSLEFYFVCKGKEFNYQNLGFTANEPITIFNHQNEGVIVSEGTRIVLNGTNLDQIKFDPAVTTLSVSKNQLEIEVPEGNITFTP